MMKSTLLDIRYQVMLWSAIWLLKYFTLYYINWNSCEKRCLQNDKSAGIDTDVMATEREREIYDGVPIPRQRDGNLTFATAPLYEPLILSQRQLISPISHNQGMCILIWKSIHDFNNRLLVCLFVYLQNYMDQWKKQTRVYETTKQWIYHDWRKHTWCV